MGSQQRHVVAREVAVRILTLQEPGESDVDFAKRVGVTSQNVWNWKNKGQGAGVDAVVNVLRSIAVHPNWLLLNVGPKWRAEATDMEAAVQEGALRVLRGLEARIVELRAEMGLEPSDTVAGGPQEDRLD